MKLSTWAKKQGVTYRTAWRWFKEGTLPVAAEQTSTGTILVKELPDESDSVVLYARVSSRDQKQDLDRQILRLLQFAHAKGWPVVETVLEVGSGLNAHRPKLLKLLRNSRFKIILVEHRDRLMRFGSEYVEAALAAHGKQLAVVDPQEIKDDLAQDMIEVLTSFCARLYGRRSARNRAKKAIEVIRRESE